MAYKVDYNDTRLTNIKKEEKQELNDVEKQYGGWADEVYDKYEGLADQTDKWAEEQKRLQNESTGLTIEKLNQDQKEAEEDYIKEQAGAYVDWQKESNKYGANAEKMASMGMTGTGFSESSQVNMYVAYQNRVAMARQSFDRITADYNLAIKDAKLQNDVLLAEIAQKAQEQRLQFLIQGTMYKQEMLDKMVTQKNAIKSRYDSKWQNTLNQINNEKAMELEERQVKIAEEKWAIEKAQQEAARIEQIKAANGSPKIIDESPAVSKDFAKIAKGEGRNVNLLKTEAKLKINSGNIVNYTDAKKLLSSLGVNPNTRLLTSAEWSKAKRDGQLGSEFEGINSYAEYVKMYCSWAVDNM